MNHSTDAGRRRRFLSLTILILSLLLIQMAILATNSRDGAAMAQAPSASVAGYGSYYLPWYDDVYGHTWLMMAQPTAGSPAAQDNWFDIYLKNQTTGLMDLMNSGGSILVNQGATSFHRYTDRIGGPVKIDPQVCEGLVSERSLFGNSFEEVWATPYDLLDSQYWWPMYASFPPAVNNWILISNPPDNADTVRVKVIIHDADPGVVNEQYVLAPGETQTPIYPGYIGGPVLVKAWREGGSEYNPADARKIVASQRMLLGGSFNEMPGVASSRLSDLNMWTWYDNISPGAANAIFISNPNSYQIYVLTIIGNPLNPVRVFGGYIEPLTTVYAVDDSMGGPVFVIGRAGEYDNTPRNVVASQQTIWGPSFSEIAGATAEDVNYSTSNFTWYDMLSPGSVNYIMVTNPTNNTMYFAVRISGDTVWSSSLGGYGRDYRLFPGLMAGPVEVEAWADALHVIPAPVLASQRVLWNGYFNEIVGKGM